MTSKKKTSEGIALLSMYGDEDDEMEDVEEDDGNRLEEISSPVATGRVMFGEQLQVSDGELQEYKSPGSARLPTPNTQATPSHSLEPIDQPESDAMNYTINCSESTETKDAVMVSLEDQKDIDPLDKFLPPPPKAKCSEELQEKIIKFLALKKTTGRSFNSEVRNRKEYRNPDFLLHAVTYQDIDQIGSCFSKEVFDPHGYDKSDFYDEIEADMRREMERREQEKKKNQKLDFASGGTQPGNVIPTPKINLPIPGLAAVAGGVINVAPAGVDVTARDGRQNKKSKWDKSDVDQRNSVSAGGQENMSAVAHAVLSAAKAGSGYSTFAQQRRKEAENKRSSERKVEKRS